MKNFVKLMLLVFVFVGAVAGSKTPLNSQPTTAKHFVAPVPPFCSPAIPWFCQIFKK